jgi:Asp-tRNA(Asn)/Glu-tRNA(Gln) amidotransferase A subunit family amidase
VEEAIADVFPLSTRINDWEWRWPLNSCHERDASKLSRAMLERIARGQAMKLSDYRAALVERERIRAVYAELASNCDACVTLTAPGAAPLGLESTGNPIFAVPFSLLGVPAISLPLLRDEGLPLGLQVTGFSESDAAAVATAAWVMQALGGVHD